MVDLPEPDKPSANDDTWMTIASSALLRLTFPELQSVLLL